MIYPSRVKTGWGRAGPGWAGWGRTYLPHAREPAKTRVHPARASSRLCLPRPLRPLLFAASASPAWLWRAGPPRAGTSPSSPRYSFATNSDALAFLLSSSAAFFINNFSPDAGLWLYVFQYRCLVCTCAYPIYLPALCEFRDACRVHDIAYIRIPSDESRWRLKRFGPDVKIAPNWNYLKGVIAASDTCVKFVEILCDLSVTTFSPDGQVFQVDFDSTGVDSSGTVVGISFKDGVVLVLPASNRNA